MVFGGSDSIGREELLKGAFASGRRAGALLFAIESRTAHLVAQSQQATALYLTKKAIEERELEFLEAIASGRQLPKPPKIQDLEKFASYWVDLVIEADPSLKAALAFALGEKYAFKVEQIPNIRIALDLDSELVVGAFQRQYNKPLTSIYRLNISRREGFLWGLSRFGSWLEALPPFWVALALTLPLGSGILALPIALAGVGPIIGVGLAIVFGLISALTTTALAESVARSSTASFGLGYLGQLVSEYLGGAGSVFLTVTLAIDSFLVLIIFYLGLADTLEAASNLSAELWIILMFGSVLFFLSRKSLNSTVASTLLASSINLILLVILPFFALPYLQPSNFTYNNILIANANTFNFSMVQLIFGVMISNYSSHLLVGNYGRVILRRDPSARSWIWGCLAAIGIATVVSCLWIIAINGALPANVLASETGTALTALAELGGPIVNWIGSAFVILSLGIGCVHISFGLFFLVDERLPKQSTKHITVRNRFFLCAVPMTIAFLVAEWLSITSQGSFAGLLGFVGVMTLPLIAGVFPVLLLAATRRKGDTVPKIVFKWLGSPIVLLGIYLLFVFSIFLHGLFAFDGKLEQVMILLVGFCVLIMSGIMLHQRALARRAVVELRQDFSKKGTALFNITANGEPALSEVCLDYGENQTLLMAARGQISNFSSLLSIHFHLPITGADELKVWAHKITPSWTSEALPAQGTIQFDGDLRELNLSHSDGQDLLMVQNEPLNVEIHMRARRHG